jgi:acetate kinase
MSLSEIDTLLNKQSGLLGLSGLTSDMRELLEEEAENQDRRARLAIEIFCRRVRRYIGAYLAEMGECRAVVFAGGIGENAPAVRRRICDGLGSLGLVIDEARNEAMVDGSEGRITTDDSTLDAHVIPTNEELLIARDAFRVLADIPHRW